MTNIAFRPLENRDTEAFWNACKESRLVLQQCADCGNFRHPPSPVCHSCLSTNHEWVDSTGRGKVWSFAIVRERVEGWPGDVPLIVVIIELDESVKLVSNLVADHNAVHIGMEVEVCFEAGPEGVNLPKFRPIQS